MTILANLGRHLAAIVLVFLPFAVLDLVGVLDLSNRRTALVFLVLSVLASSGVSAWHSSRRGPSTDKDGADSRNSTSRRLVRRSGSASGSHCP